MTMKTTLALAALLLIPSAARADAPYPPGYEKGSTYSASPNAARYDDDIRPARRRPRRDYASSICPDHISVRQCRDRYLNAKRSTYRTTEARRRLLYRDDRYDRTVEREGRIYVAQRRDRDRYRDDLDEAPRGRCAGKMISAKGDQRPSEAWANRLAIKAWQREVRYEFGETYLNFANARRSRVKCGPSSVGGILGQYRCEAVGIPCQN